MATFRVIQPLTAFDPNEKRALTIPPRALIEKEESYETFHLVKIEWVGRTVLVGGHDLMERIMSEVPE
jgi:hypothetical protein